MRISHTELVDCQSNTSRWVTKKLYSNKGPRFGYAGATKLSIYRYHKTGSAEEARQHLETLLMRFNDISKKLDAEGKLDDYMAWCVQENVIVTNWRERISLDLGNGISLGGEVSRIDLDLNTGGYRAVLLGSSCETWQEELRMPLIQRAVAYLLQRSETEVSLGVQNLDGSELLTTTFNATEIDTAEITARALAIKVADEIRRLQT